MNTNAATYILSTKNVKQNCKIESVAFNPVATPNIPKWKVNGFNKVILYTYVP